LNASSLTHLSAVLICSGDPNISDGASSGTLSHSVQLSESVASLISESLPASCLNEASRHGPGSGSFYDSFLVVSLLVPERSRLYTSLGLSHSVGLSTSYRFGASYAFVVTEGGSLSALLSEASLPRRSLSLIKSRFGSGSIRFSVSVRLSPSFDARETIWSTIMIAL
jgi:hypothetical protein